MLAPREMFCGARPIEACQELAGFTRGVLLHGLSLGLDAGPEDLDALSSDNDDYGEFEPRSEVVGDEYGARGQDQATELFTVLIDGPIGFGGRRLLGFCAMTAASEDIVRKRMAVRFGERLAVTATISAGFDPYDKRVVRLVASDMIEQLEEFAADPMSDNAVELKVAA